jgi:ABC-type dipeptide/oligopeptide/nickel transport system permease component
MKQPAETGALGTWRETHMFRFLFGRLAVLIPTFIGVSIIAFAFIRLLPGDPVALLSGERVMDPARHAEISHQLGLDRPVVIQYLDYLWGVLHGNFGTSISTKKPVIDQFFELSRPRWSLSAPSFSPSSWASRPAYWLPSSVVPGSIRRSWARL